MPTIQQLVRSRRIQINKKTKSPTLGNYRGFWHPDLKNHGNYRVFRGVEGKGLFRQ